jgi:hypothetical protein
MPGKKFRSSKAVQNVRASERAISQSVSLLLEPNCHLILLRATLTPRRLGQLGIVVVRVPSNRRVVGAEQLRAEWMHGLEMGVPLG